MPASCDWRLISAGCEIPTEGYCDQPYIVQTDDGAWLCALTTGAGLEGEPGQHVVSMRSTDQGRTWSPPVDVEPASGPEASYSVLLKAPSGRVFCIYNHNTDNLRAVKADDPPYDGGLCHRVDSQGHYVCKYSDDHGRTWSSQRYEIPVREMEIDRRNPYGGEIQFFWNVGRPFIHEGAAYVSLHKVGGFGHGFFTSSEGVLLRSANLLTEPDPSRAVWETLPEGDAGIRTPAGGGPIAEEHSYSVLGDGSLYVVYRTIDGHPGCSYSRDGGRTWSLPAYQQYADGRMMKHPRAANFGWRCQNGRYLYWFHNHGGNWYEDRNPVWLCGGVEADGPEGKVIRWSQPEIVLYDDDPYTRMSYPDLIEEGGALYLTETQKTVARAHRIDQTLLDGLWGQFDGCEVACEGLLLELPPGGGGMPGDVAMPLLPPFSERDGVAGRDLRAGFTIEMWLKLESAEAGQVVLDSRAQDGRGLCVTTVAGGALEISLCDGRSQCRWASDPGSIAAGRRCHVAIIVDGGPKIISFVIDGALNDGGDQRQFGWGRFSPHLRDANGAQMLHLGPALRGAGCGLRIYGRYLRTSEAINNWRAEH